MNSPTDQEQARDPDVTGTRPCELDQHVDILRRVPGFSGIPLEQLRLYAYLSQRRHYRPGEFVFRQGEFGNLGYVVICGRAQVIRELKEHSIFLNEFHEGDFFGLLGLLADAPWLVSVRAAEDLDCLTIDRETFQKLFRQFPEAGFQMLNRLVRRFVQMEEKLLQAGSEECLLA